MAEHQAMRALPQYQCHKKVWALKIAAINTSGIITDLSFEDPDYAPIRVDEDYMAKHKPQNGGYYVVYEDGYKSFSPARAFEDGYTRIDGARGT